MSRQIQHRRGDAAAHTNFIGAVGEITMDTTNKTLRVHDGETAGGIELAKTSELDVLNARMQISGIPDPETRILISNNSVFVAPNNGVITIDGGNNGTNKGIYYGNSANGIRLTGAFINSTTSTSIYFPVRSGKTYYIQGTGTDAYFFSFYSA